MLSSFGMKKIIILIPVLLTAFLLQARQKQSLTVVVTDAAAAPVRYATVTLFSNNLLIKSGIANEQGSVLFENIAAGSYTCTVTQTGYKAVTTGPYDVPATNRIAVTLTVADKTMSSVVVSAKKPLIQHKEGKTIVNVDAAVTNTGTTVLEVLEKSPGVMVDRNGGIALQGKAGVLVLIDDKPTYLSGAELNNLLSSMSSSQVESIELMPNPPAKYDASGNAGIINIKTKKNKVKGFNGSVTVAGTQGVYPKNNNNLVLNYRSGKFNFFLNYSLNNNKYFTSIYALRKYYDNHDQVIATLDQPTYFSGRVVNQTLKAGVDYFLSPKTTVGIVLGGTRVHRKGKSDAGATWLNATGAVDSSIITNSSSNNRHKSNLLNINLRHSFNKQQELAVDLDWLHYDINADQQFNNYLQAPGGYSQSARGKIPTVISIVSAKADYTLRFGKKSTWMAGFKSSHISTDNTTSYQNFDGIGWQEDYGRSNRFLYQENINAFYSSLQTKYKKWSTQIGLRYELTGYDAEQLGNPLQKDSAFSRHYGGLFPAGYITYQADSSNAFTFTAGRRLDRPAFQVLNPFTSIINKYTYQNGNPYIIPQYSTNLELSHQYRQWLTSTVSYSIIRNYFSQIFLNDTAAGLLYYSQGNVGRAHNLGISSTLILSPAKWWNLSFTALYNHKELKGFNGDANFKSNINQFNFNLSNQFSFAKIYSGELSGFYTSRARNDLQELLYPNSQLSLGVSRPVLKKKGTLKLSVRDIFFSNGMEGLTQFTKATEYFKLRRDSRVVSLAFTYRFGKAYKTSKRSNGSATDEMERAGNG